MSTDVTLNFDPFNGSLRPIQKISGYPPTMELGFPRPVGMMDYFIEDEIGKYVCMTQECFDDIRRKAGLISPENESK